MSEFQGVLPNPDGAFRDEWLHQAFSESDWAPYLLTSGDRPVGFAFVRGLTGSTRVLNSLFVVRGARRAGIGPLPGTRRSMWHRRRSAGQPPCLLYGSTRKVNVMSSSPPSRGRPRDPRSHEAIIGATAELVVEVGYAATSIGAVAARAGVGKDTIYRRWPGKPELVFEAVFTTTDDAPSPDTGTLAGDLTVLLQGLVDEFSAPAAAAALPGLLADFAADADLKARIRGDFLAPSKERLLIVFERAVVRGEIAAETPVDLVLDTLAGAVFFHVGLVGEHPDPRLATRLAAVVAKGIEVR